MLAAQNTSCLLVAMKTRDRLVSRSPSEMAYVIRDIAGIIQEAPAARLAESGRDRQRVKEQVAYIKECLSEMAADLEEIARYLET